MDASYRMTRKPALFRRRAPRAGAALAALFALLAALSQGAVAQEDAAPASTPPLRDLPIRYAQPVRAEAGAPVRAAGWLVALVLVILALRQGEEAGVTEDA